MEDTLLAQRKNFDEMLDGISRAGFLPIKKLEMELVLINSEGQAELSYRSGLARGKIIGLGLEKFMPEIIDGMNKSATMVCPHIDIDPLDYSSKQIQTMIRENSDALRIFGMDYLDRWVMYNNLFNNK